jgi:hypothetical protein
MPDDLAHLHGEFTHELAVQAARKAQRQSAHESANKPHKGQQKGMPQRTGQLAKSLENSGLEQGKSLG